MSYDLIRITLNNHINQQWNVEQAITVCAAAGGGLLQRGLQGSGELGDGLHAGEDPEGLEETGSDEDLLLCFHCTCESDERLVVSECCFNSYVHFITFTFLCLCLVSQQLHMGKQAEEQQKYGERVGQQTQSIILHHHRGALCVFNYLFRTEIKSFFLSQFFHFPPCPLFLLPFIFSVSTSWRTCRAPWINSVKPSSWRR